jgi:formate-nitrite transporter family protein
MVRSVAERRERDGDGESSRPHALDIYERICEDTEEELSRPQGSLFFSALFAGFAIGLSALAVALATVTLTPEVKSTAFIAALLYPIGYLAVIVGRSQFFTENTLYPVMLTMRKKEYLSRTTRLWAIVFPMNLVGAFIFALLAVTTGALDSSVQSELASNGVKYTDGSFIDTFWSAVIVGFLLATVAWLVEGCDTVTGRVAVIWALTFFVSLASLDHCVATTVTAFSAMLDGALNVGDVLGWLLPAFLGNVFGGVVIVAAINYGQVREED